LYFREKYVIITISEETRKQETRKKAKKKMKVTIQHQCGHARAIEVKGIQESRQYQRWLSEKICPSCQEKQDEYQAKVDLVHMGVRQLGSTTFLAPSQTEPQDHIVMVDETGQADYCSCKWFKYGGWAQHKCAHGLAVEAYIVEEQAAAAAAA
jgi:hypothetical protein